MPTKVLMPSLSPTMTEGTLAKWLKKEGDEVAAGDALAEIETDKATMELEAVDEGKLARILVPEGAQAVPVNKTIAVLLGEDEDESALEPVLAEAEKEPAEAASAPAEGAEKPRPEAGEKPRGKEATQEPAAPSAPAEGEGKPRPAAPAPEAPAAKAPPAPQKPSGGRVFASPLARRLAAQAGIELARIAGSGPHGRVVKADIEQAKARGVPRAAPAAAPAAEVPLEPPFTEIPLTPMRKAIARRLVEAKREAPHFYLTIDCELARLLAVRAEVNAEAKAGPEGEGVKLSVNDFVVRAVALALERVPAANVAWFGETLRQYSRADVSVAVAVPDGLVTPIVRDAGRKGLAAISREMRALAERARAGRLRPEDYEGGTFTVSNLGMYGIKEFAAVLNPPQACLLAVGRAEERPVVRDGAIEPATMMTCTLSIDHRAVDGAIGAEFLAAFKRLIENPLTMMI